MHFFEKKIFHGHYCILKISPYLCTAFEKCNELSFSGEMAEWSIATVLKTAEVRASRGSNPCLSALKKRDTN